MSGAIPDAEDAAALSPLSPDRTVGYVDVPITGGYSDVTDELRDSLGAAAQVGRDAGLTVEVSGSAAVRGGGAGRRERTRRHRGRRGRPDDHVRLAGGGRVCR